MTNKRYSLHEQLGAGGMAEVFRATLEREAGFRKTVAVKRLLPSLVRNPKLVKMLIDEARILSELSHPNIVSVLDFEKTDQAHFLVLEYVHGRSLAQLIGRCGDMEQRIPPGLPHGLGPGNTEFLHRRLELPSGCRAGYGEMHADGFRHRRPQGRIPPGNGRGACFLE